jgi:hypothetical protein
VRPHRRQARARVSAARSSSMSSRNAWNLASSNAMWHIGGSLLSWQTMEYCQLSLQNRAQGSEPNKRPLMRKWEVVAPS